MEEESNYNPESTEEEKPAMWLIILTWILKLPLIFLIIGSWAASFYAAYMKIQGITYTVPIVYTVFVILFAVGWIIRIKLK